MRIRVVNILLFVFAFFLSAIHAAAVENSLSGIDIKYSDTNGYNIILKTDKTAQVNKSFDENDNLILTINKTLPSEGLEIVYDNPEELTNIIVQKKNKTNTLVFLQGNNIADAKVYTKDLSTGIIKEINAKNTFFFVADKKIFSVSMISIILFFFLSVIRRQKKEKYTNVNAKELKNRTVANTLRKKNLTQSKNIPSINYKVNAQTSIPKDFIINKNGYAHQEKIAKAG